ncbi:MAG: DUF1549 domain-containing protein, partial [Planctomycetaceae bacterium]|nr:DUF1549 domain-containing protein [Planctomycetaceae bacterium]
MNRIHQFMIPLLLMATWSPQPVFSASEPVDYVTQVKPILRERCFTCHGSLKQESGLRLDTAALIKQGGDAGAAITLNEAPENSLLIQRVKESDPALRMPPEHEGGPLTPEQIQILQQWIAAGAQAPEGEVSEKDPRQHWAFQPVIKPVVPEVSHQQWADNPIDAFIAQGHEKQGLTAQQDAPRLQLLRRLHFDLTGLPPTAAEIETCLLDPSEEWYEKTVDRLLADPRHGQRWARHWMDIWRYSDWWGLGTQLRNSQPHIWHWRDWIVESLNEDTPYDEMVRLMLAADEIAPTDQDQLRATGFLARNYYIFNRMRWMDETVEHVGKGFLGLTLNCAKCHDHKFDPIDQVDYYRLRAFFEPYLVRLDMVPGEVDLNRDGIPRSFDALLEEPTYRYIRGDEARPDQTQVIQPGIPELLAFAPLEIREIELPPVASQPERQPWVLENHIAAAQTRLAQAEQKLLAAQKALEKAKALDPPRPPQHKDTPGFAPLLEDFAQLDPARWKLVNGEWSHAPGSIRQTADGPQRSILQLMQEIPQDFEARLRFRLHGGSQYRSIGIAFDSTGEESRDPHFLIYASGHLPGQKVQAAFDQNGTWQYPGDGRTAISLELETDYTLHLQVRDRLMNVSLNGEPMLAWRAPVPRHPGLLQLITFDALATFFEFQISELPAETTLREPGSATGNSLKQAESNLKLAKLDREIAQAELDSIEARAAAMRAAWDSLEEPLVQQKTRVAIHTERVLAVAQAQRNVIAAEVAVSNATKEKAEESQNKLKTAREQLTKAEAVLNQEIQASDQFTPLTGSKWSATRFRHT